MLGSGLSRSAEIPTGWEITTDLVRRIATAKGVDEQEDWAKWYSENEGKEPNYSELLEKIATSPSERRAILHSYIEPNEEDRQEGRKVPTAGHKAIASLVQKGYIKVIVTTNFDRLMENALREVGVEPTVITSPDALQGAEPITHSSCYILKLHGDYKDARILNTDEELDNYPAAYNSLLDRIFDEYGLIVCGWSGEWDHALRAAIQRAPNRRYPMFWASRGVLAERGADLCSSRKGVVVPISDADTFFGTLVSQVDTLAQSQRQNPVGVDMLVGRAKRYLSKAEYRIQLADLVFEEVEKIIARHDQGDMDLHGAIAPEDIQRRVAVYESISEGLTKACGLIGRWGEPSQIAIVIDAIRTILNFANDNNGGLVIYIELRQYPAVLAYHACALGLQYAEKWPDLHEFMGTEVQNKHGNMECLLDTVGPSTWEGSVSAAWKALPGLERRYTPFQDHLANTVFKDWRASFLSSRAPIDEMTLLSEALTAIQYLERSDLETLRTAIDRSRHERNYVWAPVGRAGWSHSDYMTKTLPRLENADLCRRLAHGGFGGGSEEFIKTALQNYKNCIASYHWH